MVAVTLATCGTTMALSAMPASARTITLHFFSKQVYSSFTGPTGQPLGPTAAPALGDRFSFADDDYVGNHRHHARTPFASDHSDCTIVSAGTALCDGQLALGGSMLFANNFAVSTSSSSGPSKVPINGGTNQYRHAHGTVLTKSLPHSNNTDTTVIFTP